MAREYNKFPWVNTHGFNLNWVIETVKECKATVDGIVEEVANIFNNYVTKDDLTNTRKLSENGDFTGTWDGEKQIDVVSGIDSNKDQIQYLTSQFSDGQTGLIVDGGFFTDTGIKKNYDGGKF